VVQRVRIAEIRRHVQIVGYVALCWEAEFCVCEVRADLQRRREMVTMSLDL
jgi:hypothetical protein